MESVRRLGRSGALSIAAFVVDWRVGKRLKHALKVVGENDCASAAFFEWEFSCGG